MHYLALRRHDLRELQDRLAAVGLSSLGRAEPCVAATLTGVLELLARSCGSARPERPSGVLTLDAGRRRLAQTTELLLGRPRDDRKVRILVTLPPEAADDAVLVRDLVRSGMDAARINCAHDTPAAWERMIAHVRRASAELSTDCRVLMDLPGPKLRTGALQPGPRVVKLKPRRDPHGYVVQPARAWLNAGPGSPGAVVVPVPDAWLAGLRVGEVVKLVDARGARRTLHTIDITATGALVEAYRTTYIHTGACLQCANGDGVVGELPPVEQPLVLRPGDHPTADNSTGKDRTNRAANAADSSSMTRWARPTADGSP